MGVPSLPSRERGLKYPVPYRSTECKVVAPFAGAWIEISVNTFDTTVCGLVAPFAGAWIEMVAFWAAAARAAVAPFAGAWIEIFLPFILPPRHWSLPSRERGLKYCHAFIREYVPASLPSRERGLKCHNILSALLPPHVAPFAGAWIEI